MKCAACDCILSDREATRKGPSGEFLELCDHDLANSGIYEVVDNPIHAGDTGDVLIDRSDIIGQEEIPAFEQFHEEGWDE